MYRRPVIAEFAPGGERAAWTQDRSLIVEDVGCLLRDLGDRLRVLGGSTLLVTGASGFLCSYFIETVAALNHAGLAPPCRLIAVDNLRTSASGRLAHLRDDKEIVFLWQDVTLPLVLDRRVDWLIHGASIASPASYRRWPLETIDVNVTGTRQMLELARQSGTRSMLFLSSSEIYGDPDPGSIPTPEDYRGNVSCTGPRACYDESKRLAETLCVAYRRLFHLPVKIARPFNVYGPGQPLEDARIIPDLMRSATRGEPIVLFSNGAASRAFCYITDAVRAMWHLLLSDAEGEAFNVGNDQEEIRILDLAELMRQVAGPPWLEIRSRASNDPHYLTDNPQRRRPDLSKLRSRFGWEPQVSLREGLDRTLRYYRRNVAGMQP